MPRASKEKVEAFVYKKMYETKHMQEEPEDPQLTLKPDMSRTLRNTRHKKYHHTGKYGKCEWIKPENKPAVQSEKQYWSCCMNGDPDSEGCVAKVKDKQKWILSSHA